MAFWANNRLKESETAWSLGRETRETRETHAYAEGDPCVFPAHGTDYMLPTQRGFASSNSRATKTGEITKNELKLLTTAFPTLSKYNAHP